ncbi:MAG: hypothetical protein J0L99_04475 [Chitinophagales bacterium]|nr:hypothetical protein [Chitinophagales bacterium]
MSQTTGTSSQTVVQRYNELIFNRLLEFRKTHPDFYYHLRTNKKRELLEAGHWFPGTHYVHVGLVTAASGDHSTKSVSFMVDCGKPEAPSAHFIVLFKNNPAQNIKNFYFALKEALGMREVHHDFFVFDYGNDVEKALNTFLEEHWPTFQRLIKQHGLESLAVSENSFTNKLNNIWKLRGQSAVTEERIARICWNTNAWVSPSGPLGKSTYEEAFEYRYGFGFEEWLLDMDKVLDDGYHYAFLQPVNSNLDVNTGKTFNVKLFTRNSEEKANYWVGSIEDIEVIDQDTSRSILIEYREKGWLDEMAGQLDALEIDGRLLKGNTPKEINAMFNIRFKPSSLSIYPELIPFEDTDIESYKSSRYKLFHVQKNVETIEDEPGLSFAPTTLQPTGLVYIRKEYPSMLRENPNRHRLILEGLHGYLQENGKTVAHELSLPNQSRVDLVEQVDKDNYIFYEVKSYNALHTCIRIALGQLLEYCCFPDKLRAQKLVVVAEHQIDDATTTYLEHLRHQFNLPLYYACFDVKTNRLSELY